MRVRAIGLTSAPKETFPRVLPQSNFPLTTMVLNVTNKCNLACTYCYEYGEDKIVDTTCDPAPNYMSEETARASVDFMFEQSGDLPVAHLTFFGGETLLNFKVLKKTAAYARERAKELGKDVDFSLTTNGTLLRDEVIDWLAENRIGVTVSIDRAEGDAGPVPASSRTGWAATTTPCRRSSGCWSGIAQDRSGPA